MQIFQNGKETAWALFGGIIFLGIIFGIIGTFIYYNPDEQRIAQTVPSTTITPTITPQTVGIEAHGNMNFRDFTIEGFDVGYYNPNPNAVTNFVGGGIKN